VQKRVLIDRLGPFRVAVAAHIGLHGAKSGRCKSWELVTPRVSTFGEAVTKKDNRAFPLLRYMDTDSIRFNNAMSEIEHSLLSCL
jgi:hypothetical protein